MATHYLQREAQVTEATLVLATSGSTPIHGIACQCSTARLRVLDLASRNVDRERPKRTPSDYGNIALRSIMQSHRDHAKRLKDHQDYVDKQRTLAEDQNRQSLIHLGR